MKLLLFLLLPFITFHFAHTPHLKTYQEFTHYCEQYNSIEALDALNRALKEVNLLHGDREISKMDPKKTAKDLKEEGYLQNHVYYEARFDPLEFYEGRFRSIRFPDLKGEDFPLKSRFSSRFIKIALRDSNYVVRLYILKYLEEFSQRKTPLGPILAGFVHEQDRRLQSSYIRILRGSHFFWKKLKKKSRRLNKKIELLRKRAISLDEKAEVLFLSFQYLKQKENYSKEVFLHSIDQDYPISYLMNLYHAFGDEQVEGLADAFRSGLGLNQIQQLYILAIFPNNRKALSALLFGLVNRKLDRFYEVQAKLIYVWQKLTKIPWKGGDKSYVEWFQKNKPAHR
ncbi:hypothetical protein MJH12_09100 [bacterium]|nr:hypothetical protein [bacterium]